MYLRFSVLQSTGKQFEKEILAYLTTAKAKEEAGNDMGSQSMLNSSQTGGIIPSQVSSQPSAIITQQQQRQMGYNRFDQERYAAKDETGGFSIDTKLTYQPNGGALSLTPNPAATPQHDSRPSIAPPSSSISSQSATQKSNIVATQPTQALTKAKLIPSPNQPVRRTHAKPIIIVPNTPTSLITLFNCLEILQELK